MRVLRLLRRSALVGGLAAMFALSASPSALGDVGQQIITRCLQNQSLAGFSQAAYGKALKELSATTEEYSDCASLIRAAQRSAASGKSGAGGAQAGGGLASPTAAIVATPTEQRAIVHAARSGSQPVSLGNGDVVHPGVVHADVASAFSTLPGPLLAVLVIMLASLLGFGGAVLRKRARDGRSD
jgi:hypothetical protein